MSPYKISAGCTAMTELSTAPFEKILKKAEAKRVSKEAARELKITIEEIAQELGKEAVNAAHHAKRKTVKEVDIKFATRHN